MIDEYLHKFRPLLVRGFNAPWLFPGEAGSFKTPNMFSEQVTQRIQKATGLRVTVHQFRHAAAAIILKHEPGNFERVRLLLGHRTIRTTTNFYCGLVSLQASETFGHLVRAEMGIELGEPCP